VLHRKPNVLLLDEATSALDGISERNFLSRLNTWGDQQTIISVAHRFSTVRASDTVMIMNEGRIVGVGSVPVLSEGNDLFKSLFAADLGIEDADELEALSVEILGEDSESQDDEDSDDQDIDASEDTDDSEDAA
jgi:ABC-type multidrug transport system ATPase subunit